MQVTDGMLVVCVFLMAVAVTDGFQLNNQYYSRMVQQPYSMMNHQYYNQGYSNNRRTNGNSGFPMQYYPFLMNSDNGKKIATYSMMMNGQSNSFLPYYFMRNGMDNIEKSWPMMSLLSGNRGFNPFLMASMQDLMN